MKRFLFLFLVFHTTLVFSQSGESGALIVQGAGLRNFFINADAGPILQINGGDTLQAQGGTGVTTEVIGSVLQIDFSAALDDLTDVSAGSPIAGQVLKWNGSAWVPDTDNTGAGGMASFNLAGTSGSPQVVNDGETVLIEAGTGITTTGAATDKVTIDLSAALNLLTDVNAPTPSNGQVLKYDGAEWIAGTDETGTDAQTLSISSTTRVLSITGGNSVDMSESIMEEVAAFATAGTGIAIAHDDGGNTLTFSLDAVLNDLNDVNDGSPANNQVLKWDAGNGWAEWSIDQAGITNINIDSDDNDPFGYINGQEFGFLGGTGITTTHTNSVVTFNLTASLDDLTDVSITSPSNGQVLTYNGSAWVNSGSGGLSWTAAGDTGSQTIENGNTLNFIGGTGMSTAATATDNLTINLNAGLNDLNSVTVSSPASQDILLHNGSIWQNTELFFRVADDAATFFKLSNGFTLPLLGGDGISTETDGSTYFSVILDANIGDLNNVSNNAAINGAYLTYSTTAGEWQPTIVPPMTSFDITGDSGTQQTVTNGELVSFRGGTNTGISTTISSGNFLDINLNIANIFLDNAIADLDRLVYYDISASGHRTIEKNALISGGCPTHYQYILGWKQTVGLTSTLSSDEYWVVPPELGGRCVDAITARTGSGSATVTVKVNSASQDTVSATSSGATVNTDFTIPTHGRIQAHVITNTNATGLSITLTIKCDCSG